ncbi:MAG: ATP-binding protein [Pseudomonadota bacterium]
MTEADTRLAELCRTGVRKIWLRLSAQVAAMLIVATQLDLQVGLIFGGLTLLAEIGYSYRVWRAHTRFRATGAFGRWDEVLICAQGIHVVVAIVVFGTVMTLAEGPGYHLPAFALTFGSILYVSIFEHQKRWFLMVRAGILATAFIPIGLWDIVTADGPVTSSMMMQLLTCCVMVIFSFDCMRGMLSLYEQRRQEVIELDRAKAEAEQLTREKSAMISTMSHELRTPLNGIMGMAELIARTGDLSPATGEKLTVLRSSAQRLNTLLTDVLDTEKLMAEKMEVLPVESCLRNTLLDAVEQHRGSAETKGLSLLLDLPKDAPGKVVIDPVRVNQCLANLLTNAIKFTSNGEIRVTAHHSGSAAAGRLSVDVRDNGIGMTKEQIGNLFSQFSQGDSTISRRYGGTGLGLWISRNLARQMGGDLIAHSVPGEGSVFTLTIDAPAARSDFETASATLHGLEVLNVEDVAVNRQIVNMMLSRFGVSLTEAETAEDALDIMENRDFDLVMTDGNLPGMSGMDFVRALRSSGRPTARAPIVCVSADNTYSDPEKRAALGLSGFVPKPFDERTLIAALTRAARPQT